MEDYAKKGYDEEKKDYKHHYGAGKIIGMVIGGIVTAVVLGFLFGFFVMLLWNWLMPSVFGLKKIDYWQAFGIIILARLIFGGFGNDNGHHKHKKKTKRNKKWVEENWKVKGGWKNWKHYDVWWTEEGKKRYEEYIDRVEKTKNQQDDEIKADEEKETE